MRIGVDATILASNNEGIGNYLRELIKNLNDTEQFQFIFFTTNNLNLNDQQLVTGRNIVINVNKGKFIGIRTAFLIAKIARKQKCQLLLSTYSHILPLFYLPCWWLIYDISPLIHPEYFFTHHNFLIKIKNLPRKLVFNFLFKAAVKSSSRLLTISDFSKTEIANYFKISTSKIGMIGSGPTSWVNQEIDLATELKVLNQYDLKKYKYFVFIGTLSPRKNISLLISAFTNLLQTKSGHGFKLVIIGKKGWLYESIFTYLHDLTVKYSHLRLNKMIIFTDFIEATSINVLTKNSLALINPSFYEGFGMPPLEALMLGKEVILSNIPIFQASFLNIAHFFNPYSAQELTTCMEDIINGQILNNKSELEKLISKNNFNLVAEILLQELTKYA